MYAFGFMSKNPKINFRQLLDAKFFYALKITQDKAQSGKIMEMPSKTLYNAPTR